MSFAYRAHLSENESFSIFYRDSSSVAANTASTTITIPATTKPGDALILVLGWSISSGQNLTAPSGWTVIGSKITDESQVASMVLQRTAQLGDQASNVPIVLDVIANVTAFLMCYGNASSSPIDVCTGAAQGATSTTTHDAPSITLSSQREWLISAVIDKAVIHSTTWTPPSGLAQRASAFNTAATAVTASIADSGSNLKPGVTGIKTWTSDQTTSRAITWSIGLKRGDHPNKATLGGSTGGEILIGAASLDWDSMLAKAGMMSISRTYENSMSSNLATTYYGPKQISWFWDQGMTVAHTFKPDMALLAAQDPTTMATLNSMLQSAQGKKVWWCLWHEPENDTIGVADSNNSFSLSNYIAAWRVFANTMHAYNEPGWKSCWVMMSYTWKQSFLGLNAGFTADSWWPGDQYVDIIGVDDYNEGSLHSITGDSTPQRWDSPGYGFGNPNISESQSPNGGGYNSPILMNWIAIKGKDYGIFEFGTVRNLESAKGRNKTDVATGPYTLDWWTSAYGGTNSKADWIKDYAKFHMEIAPATFGTTCRALMYFDYPGRKWKGDNIESWELFHTPGDVDYTAISTVRSTYIRSS